MSDSAVSVSASAPTKSPGLNSLEVEVIGRGGRPQPQRVDRLAAVADHRPIERDADQTSTAGRGCTRKRAAVHLERAAELDLDHRPAAGRLPTDRGGAASCPAARAASRLRSSAEDAVFVAQPVAHRRELHRRHGVEEAGRQPAQAAVAQAGVGLLLEQGEPVELLLHR